MHCGILDWCIVGFVNQDNYGGDYAMGEEPNGK